MMRSVRYKLGFISLIISLLLGCGESGAGCADCGTVVVAAPGEPSSLVPPLVDESSFRPGLAQRWEQVDSLTWLFHLRPDARWQDGRPVTAADVVFSFEAFSDSTLNAGARGHLAGRVQATADDSTTVRVRFTEPSPEQLYDATYHVRVLPRQQAGKWVAQLVTLQAN